LGHPLVETVSSPDQNDLLSTHRRRVRPHTIAPNECDQRVGWKGFVWCAIFFVLVIQLDAWDCHTIHKQDHSLSPSTWSYLLSNMCCAHAGSCEAVESCGKGEHLRVLLHYACEDIRCHAGRIESCFMQARVLLPLSACTHTVPLHARPTHPRTSDGVCCRSRVMNIAWLDSSNSCLWLAGWVNGRCGACSSPAHAASVPSQRSVHTRVTQPHRCFLTHCPALVCSSRQHGCNTTRTLNLEEKRLEGRA
jgi:hypothetical protein